MHDALSAEHRTRYAMQSAQWAHDNAAPDAPSTFSALLPDAWAGLAVDHDDEAANPRDDIEVMSRTPRAVSDWESDVAASTYAPDRVMTHADIDALLDSDSGATYEGLMTALIGGTQDQGLRAMWLMRKSFVAWAEDRIQPENV